MLTPILQSKLFDSLPQINYFFGHRYNQQIEPGKEILSQWRTTRPSFEQVHGIDIADITESNHTSETLKVDGLTTQRQHQWVGVQTADCVPILIYHPHSYLHHRVTALHAGWRGTFHSIIENYFKNFTLQERQQCIAVIGPCIHACCYEVSDSLMSDFINQYQDRLWVHSIASKPPDSSKPHLNLPLINEHLLKDLGIQKTEIIPACTACSPWLESYRRDGKNSLRQWSLIQLK
jgi:YfiH family protein